MKRFLQIIITFLTISAGQINAQTLTAIVNGSSKAKAATVCGFNILPFNLTGIKKDTSLSVYGNDNYSTPMAYIASKKDVTSFGSFTLPGGTFTSGLHVLTVTNRGVKYSNEVVGRVPNGLVTVDGIVNEPYIFEKSAGESSTVSPIGIQFGTLWDDNYLYIVAKFIDNTPNDSPLLDNDYNYDSFELYLDPLEANGTYWGNSACSTGTPCSYTKQLRVGSKSNTINLWPSGTYLSSQVATHSFTGSVIGAKNPPVLFEGVGWIAEFKISWMDFYGASTAPGENFSFGYEVAYNDNANGAGRTNQVFWPGVDGSGYATSVSFGTAQLGPNVTTSVGTTFIERGERFVDTFRLFVQESPIIETNLSLTGDCASGITVGIPNPGPPVGSGELFYWQTSQTGTSTSNPATAPYVAAAPIIINGITLRSLNPKGCWSAPLAIEFIPSSPGQYLTPAIITNYLCLDGEFIASVPGIANNALYWQTTGTGTDMTISSMLVQSISGVGYYEEYLRALNTITGCWSNGSAYASMSITGIKPMAPATINGVGIANCKGYELNYLSTVPSGVVWYWQLSTVTAPVRMYSGPTFFAEYAGDFYLRAEFKGCWSDTIRSYNVTDSGLPDIRNVVIDAVTPACEKTEVKVSSSYVKPPSLSLYWEFNSTDTLIVNDATSAITVTTPGVVNVYLRAKDNTLGCWSAPSNTQVMINAKPPKPEDPTGDTLSCNRALVSLAPVVGVDFTNYWESSETSTGDSLVASGSRVLTASGTYFVRARNNDANNCWSDSSGKINVIVEQTPAAPASLTELVNGCGATTITSSIAQPVDTKYFWQPNDTSKLVNNPGQNFKVNKKGTNTYYVRARTDKAQCWSDSNSISVTIGVSTVPSPVVSIASIEYTHNDPSVPLTIAGVESPIQTIWYTDTSSASASANAPTPGTENVGMQTFYVSLIQDHCESPKTAIVVNIVEAVISYDKGHWGITPNGDSHNDAFVIDHIQNFKDNKLTIIDKWGNKVYEMINYDNKFAGKHDDKELPIGTYYYVLDLRDGKLQAGTLTILR